MGVNNIIIAACSADSVGSIRFKFNPNGSDIYSSDRRVSRQATLDGEVVIIDLGFTHGDRTFDIAVIANEALQNSIKHLHETYTSVTISVREGLFLGVIQRVNENNGEVKLGILLKEKLT